MRARNAERTNSAFFKAGYTQGCKLLMVNFIMLIIVLLAILLTPAKIVWANANSSTTKTVNPVKQVMKSPVSVKSVSLDNPYEVLAAGTSKILKARILPLDATNQKVWWQSSSVSVAQVDANGQITGIHPGSAIITAYTVDGKKSASCEVIVTGSLALSDGVGQERLKSKIPNGLWKGTIPNQSIMTFRLAAVGEDAFITAGENIKITLSSIYGVLPGEINQARLFIDTDGDGTPNGQPITSGFAETINNDQDELCFTVLTPHQISSGFAKDYVLQISMANWSDGDTLTMDPGCIKITAVGGTSGQIIPVNGGITGRTIICPDGEKPEINIAEMTSNNANPDRAKIGDCVTLKIKASEPIEIVELIIAGHKIDAVKGSNLTEWTASLTMSNNDTETLIPFNIIYRDLSGNIGLPPTINSLTKSVIFDKKPPFLLSPITGQISKGGGSVKLVFSEVLSSESKTAVQKAIRLACTEGNIGFNWYEKSSTLTITNGDGSKDTNFTKDVSLEVMDRAGNKSTVTIIDLP